MLYQIKAQLYKLDKFRSISTVLFKFYGRILGLYKAFERFSSTLQGRFNLQGLEESLLNSSTWQACVNPVMVWTILFVLF